MDLLVQVAEVRETLVRYYSSRADDNAVRTG